MYRAVIVLITIIQLATFVIAESSDKIVAVVGDDIITEAEARRRYDVVRDTQEGGLHSDAITALKLQVLDSLINEKLLLQETKRMGLLINQDEIDSRIVEIEERKGLKKNEFIAQMEEQGLSKAVITEQIRGGLLWQKFLDMVIEPRLDISEAELSEFIEKYHPSKVKVNGLLISSSKSDGSNIIMKLQRKSSGCSNIEEIKSSAIRDGLEANVVTSVLSSISDQKTRKAISYAQVNSKPYVYETKDKINFILVCEKKYLMSDNALNSIKQDLKRKKMEAQAKYYIENLRKKTYIEMYDFEV